MIIENSSVEARIDDGDLLVYDQVFIKYSVPYQKQTYFQCTKNSSPFYIVY